MIISWCEGHCTTFANVVAHLTDTLIRIFHYNGHHALHQAKQAQQLSSVDNALNDADTANLRTLLQAIWDNKHLPDDLKIPSKA